MTIAHPYRYPIAFRRQFDRLENLVPGITDRAVNANASNDFLERELQGAAPADFATQNQRLRHLERLIADWRIDGETTYSTHVNFDSRGNATLGFEDVPPSVSYIFFDRDPILQLDDVRGGRIEGVYMREIASDGKPSIELTFVCDEQGWADMNKCYFGEAVKVGARISIGVIPLQEEISAEKVVEKFACDPVFRQGRAFNAALSTAAQFSTQRLWKGFRW
ncbi:hypothetical protein [Rhizobium sp. Rhizsp82]|uniref:hypothetical protein n=1 Tax=Rhizobium sp. Rhizsp82 TaxID=3243057 RepID=UPI0039B69670